jgi:hypothetical protein
MTILQPPFTLMLLFGHHEAKASIKDNTKVQAKYGTVVFTWPGNYTGISLTITQAVLRAHQLLCRGGQIKKQ